MSMWELSKASSPKLNFYHQIKHEFLPEKYLSLVKISEARNSLTRFRISSHNLFIERGRYETPIIPRQNRQCLHCYFTTGVKTLEDEIHALATCPLYNVVRGRFGFSPDQNELIDSLSDQSLTPAQATTIAKTIHAILSINEKHLEYYRVAQKVRAYCSASDHLIRKIFFSGVLGYSQVRGISKNRRNR